MIIHKTLANGEWFKLSLVEQMANVGCDVDRTIRWRQKGDLENSRKAFERALELLQFTIADPKNKTSLRELTAIKEAIGSYFFHDNIYRYTEKELQRYFFSFNYKLALQKGK